MDPNSKIINAQNTDLKIDQSNSILQNILPQKKNNSKMQKLKSIIDIEQNNYFLWLQRKILQLITMIQKKKKILKIIKIKNTK